MSAKILSGKDLASKIKEELKQEVQKLKEQGIVPGLAVIIVGDNPASRMYVNMKKNDCAQVGIESYEYAFGSDITEDELIGTIEKLNNDPKVFGILVQLPLPKHIDEKKIIFKIDPQKDVDCFHPVNAGRLFTDSPMFLPCTPAGIMELLEEYKIEIKGKECVVVGRSNIVGKPQAILLLNKHGTVTICHSRTKNLSEVTKRADVLVVAVGRAGFIKGEDVKPGAVVIDVGANKDENNKTVGDTEFSSVSEVASAITPPVGGVGPMTRAMLLKNTVTSAKNR